MDHLHINWIRSTCWLRCKSHKAFWFPLQGVCHLKVIYFLLLPVTLPLSYKQHMNQQTSLYESPGFEIALCQQLPHEIWQCTYAQLKCCAILNLFHYVACNFSINITGGARWNLNKGISPSTI